MDYLAQLSNHSQNRYRWHTGVLWMSTIFSHHNSEVELGLVRNNRRQFLCGLVTVPFLGAAQLRGAIHRVQSTKLLTRIHVSGSIAQTTAFDSAYSAASGSTLFYTGFTRKDRSGLIFPSWDDPFVYDAGGKQFAFADPDLRADRFGVGPSESGEENLRLLNQLIRLASHEAAGSSERRSVLVPPASGAIALAGKIVMHSHVTLINQAHLRFEGPPSVGHFVQVTPPVPMRQPGRLRNVEITGGGIFDANHVGNTNAIAVGNRDNNDPDGLLDVWIHDVTAINAVHGGPHIADDEKLSDVVRGGGKGLTVQFGAKNVLIERVVARDCDIGLSIEGKHTRNGFVREVTVKRFEANHCSLMAAYLSGSYKAETYGTASQAVITDFAAINCADGNLFRTSNPVAAELGVITCSAASNIRFQGIVRNQGRREGNQITLIRGSHRDCQFELSVETPRIRDLVNAQPAPISKQSKSSSKDNRYLIDVFLSANKAFPLVGYLFREAEFQLGRFEAHVVVRGRSISKLPLPERIANSNGFDGRGLVQNMHDGQSYQLRSYAR